MQSPDPQPIEAPQQPAFKGRLRAAIWAALPLLILFLALGVRLYGIDWDQGALYHPDERAILMRVEQIDFPPLAEIGTLLDAEESPLNPKWFPYGSLPIYMVKALTIGPSPFSDWGLFELRLVGRVLSATADVGTVLFVFLLGTRFFGRRVGLLAALMTALAVLHIQLSHFYTVDTFLTLFVVASVYFMARVAGGGGWRHSLAAGAFIGLAMASKVSAIPLLFPLGLAHIMALVYQRDGRYEWRSLLSGVTVPTALRLGAAGVAALATFFFTTPYAFLDWTTYFGDIFEQSQMVRREIDLPYTRQYVDTTSYLYPIRQLAVWGLGLPLGLLAWLALPVTVVVALVRRWPVDILILAWVLPYFLINGSFDVKFMRYLLPITPFLLLMVARLFFSLRDVLDRHRPQLAKAVTVAMAGVVVMTGLYAFAFLQIYSDDHTANRTAEWFQENAERGAVVLKEHWEEGIRGMPFVETRELPLYDPDGPTKLQTMASDLSEAEYMVFFSNRLYGTISRLPERYPLTRHYYNLLFSGQLGFDLVHFETSYPRLPGVAFLNDTFNRPDLPTPVALQTYKPEPISLDLGFADESFTVYDHPKVMVFQKTSDFNKAYYKALLDTPPFAISGPQDGLMMTPEVAGVQQASGTWSRLFDRDSLVNKVPLLFWLLFVQVIWLVTIPLAMTVFRPLPDRGFLLALPLGLLLVSYIAWILASLHWLAFSPASVFLAILAVAGASVFLLRSRGQQIGEALRGKGRLFLIGQGVFLAAFLAFYLVRLANPDLWHPWLGGEKPMDFAYLNAVVRSVYMPPFDPWFSGGYLNYYYFGQFIVATIIKGTGILPEVAYNLAVPLFFALTVALAFSIVYNLAASLRSRGGFFAWPPLLAGGLAAVFVTVLGNLDGAVQLVQGAWASVVRGNIFPTFDFWRSSRLMPEPEGVASAGHEITEFPFFTFLFADLHAHLMALPFTLLVLALGLSFILGMRQGRSWKGHALVLGIMALAIGVLRAINTWDYPTFLVIGGVLIFVGLYAGRGRLSWGVIWKGAALGLAVLAAGYLLMYPFIASYETFFASVERSEWKTLLWQYLGIHGLFIFIIVTFLIFEGLRRHLSRSTGSKAHKSHTLDIFSGQRRIGATLTAAGIAIILGALVVTGYAVVAMLLGFLGVVVLLGLRHLLRPSADTPESLIILVLLAAGLGLGIIVDFITLEGDIDRMNTVFKFYLQGWVLLALVAAFALARMGIPLGGLRRNWASVGKVAWIGMLAVLIFSASIYTLLGTRDRLSTRFDTSFMAANGTAYMDGRVYQDQNGPIELDWDKDAIHWLQENVIGSPVIMEGRAPLYRWGSRMSIYTGLPTVLGWDWHQRQQRWGYQSAISRRISDVQRFYTTLDVRIAQDLLDRYNVQYVIVGQQERLYYQEEGEEEDGIAKFDQMVADGQLELANPKNPQTHIYRVVWG
jgi:YYY domain-containing protein